MDNHVHLLATQPKIGAIARLMQKLGRGHVGQFNARHRGTGTLWEGRYKASLVDSESYVLHCHRYELNPLRARMSDLPATFPWSRCATHCGFCPDAILSRHPEYTALASIPEARAQAYRQLLDETLADDGLKAIRAHLQQRRALGRDDFRAMIEAKTRRFAGVRPANRPSRENSAVSYLKIDRSFITGLPGDANDAAITEAILAMAKSLGLITIAEGIETEAQHDFLHRAGCTEGQGYLYSYPLKAEEIQALLSPLQPGAAARLRLVPPKRG